MFLKKLIVFLCLWGVGLIASFFVIFFLAGFDIPADIMKWSQDKRASLLLLFITTFFMSIMYVESLNMRKKEQDQ